MTTYASNEELNTYTPLLEEQDGNIGGQWGEFQIVKSSNSWVLLFTHDDCTDLATNPFGIAEVIKEDFSSESDATEYATQLEEDGWCL